jgi:hypothetical protein
MKTLNNDPRPQISQSESKNSEYSTKELEKMEQAIEDCKKNNTSNYMIFNGKPYLITPDGAMLYEGTTTVAYSQSKHSGEE